MVLDDDEANLELLPYALSCEFPHLDIDPVLSPIEALQQLGARDYGLLITDFRMPEMDGLTVLQKARTIRPEISVVIMSSQFTIVQASLALDHGAFDVLPKRINRGELARIVELALQTHHARRDVKSRQLIIQRLNDKIAALEASLQPGKIRRSPPPPRMAAAVRSSRARTERSFLSVRESLQGLAQRAQVLNETLRQAEERLRAVLVEAQVRALGRFESFSEIPR
jgi:DNA-binding response OmpR family regulator